MLQRKQSSIIFVLDPHAPRERLLLLNRALNALRTVAELQVLPSTLSEKELLVAIKKKPPSLILVPWHCYVSWTSIEVELGLNRTGGTALAGYFVEPINLFEKIGDNRPPVEYMRAIFLDFSGPQLDKPISLIFSLLHENRRSGLTPLLERSGVIYFEKWIGGIRLGPRIDAIMGLPEIANSKWNRRGNEIRSCVNALWSLIYEEGPGKGDLTQMLKRNGGFRALFEIGYDSKALFFRLFFTQSATPKDWVSRLWPGNSPVQSPLGMLSQYTDFLRVNWVAENQHTELTAGLWINGAENRAPERCRSFWFTPISSRMMAEMPEDLKVNPFPIPGTQQLRNLPNVPAPHEETPLKSVADDTRVEELLEILEERDEMLEELREGGLGSTNNLPPPEMEELLEAFRERLFEASLQIRKLEKQIQEFENAAPSETQENEQIDQLHFKLKALIRRKEGWTRLMQEILQEKYVIKDEDPWRKGA